MTEKESCPAPTSGVAQSQPKGDTEICEIFLHATVTRGLAEASPGSALKQQWLWHFCSWTESTSVFPCSNFLFSIRLLTSNITCGKDCGELLWYSQLPFPKWVANSR